MSLFMATKGGAVDDLLDEFDLLEKGGCKEVLKETAIQPVSSPKGWKECFILNEGKSQFRMYEESGKLLLTAKKVHGDYYISQYEEFPTVFKGPAHQKSTAEKVVDIYDINNTGTQNINLGRRYCSILKLNPSKRGYTLYSCSCELCDNHLNKFNCGVLADSDQRQILALISHRTKIIDQTEIDARCLDVQIPAFMPDKTRMVWCPRTMSNGVHSDLSAENFKLRRKSSFVDDQQQNKEGELDSKTEEEEEEEKSKEESDWDSDDDERDRRNRRGQRFDKNITSKSGMFSEKKSKTRGKKTFSASENGDRYYFSTKLPKWNDNIQSLVLRFRNGRVKLPSSKNFVLTDKNDKSNVIFQLGKSEEGRFNLDFKHPISPLQAFGIALTAYGFTIKKK